MFMDKIQENLNVSVTENGALGYKTTNHELLDMNFKVSSYRNLDEHTIVSDFKKAYNEDPQLALKFLFYLRDREQGLGERRSFRVILRWMADENPNHLMPNLLHVPFYGRWDDLWDLLDTPLKDEVVRIVKLNLQDDIMSLQRGGGVSLLGKWLPSAKASSKKRRYYSSVLCKALGLDKKKYIKLTKLLRSNIDVVEKKMTSNKWKEIDYSAVPSRANLIYKSAFLRHDYDRRVEYLDSVENGEEHINASVLAPYEIFNDINKHVSSRVDKTNEQLWRSLPDVSCENTLVVADGSGSMDMNYVGNSDVSAWDVAHSLAVYFSERNTGQFKDKYITFSSRPQFVDLSNMKCLSDKISECRRHCEIANTDIMSVFNLILKTAIQYELPQNEMPENILILSDMEFDSCAEFNGREVHESSYSINDMLFNEISGMYAEYGYQLPKIVFWNIISRSNVIPMKENELGVTLISGFNQNTYKMAMSNKTDPYEALIEVLESDRYEVIK